MDSYTVITMNKLQWLPAMWMNLTNKGKPDTNVYRFMNLLISSLEIRKAKQCHYKYGEQLCGEEGDTELLVTFCFCFGAGTQACFVCGCSLHCAHNLYIFGGVHNVCGIKNFKCTECGTQKKALIGNCLERVGLEGTLAS